MSKPGPKPKPTNLKILHGTRKDRLNTREPVPATGDVVAPHFLSDEARAVWDRLAPDLIEQQILTPWDVDTFAVYCDAVATFEKAIQLVDKAVLVRGSYQSLKRNPALQVARDTAQTIRLFAQEFGLTPSARSQLKSPLAEPDGLGPERFFSGL